MKAISIIKTIFESDRPLLKNSSPNFYKYYLF
jgi:hypothetical protein